jgi:hypothetical protein
MTEGIKSISIQVYQPHIVEQRGDYDSEVDNKYYRMPAKQAEQRVTKRKVVPRRLEVHFTSYDTFSAVLTKCLDKLKLPVL